MGISVLIYAVFVSFSGFFLAKRAFPTQPKMNGLLSVLSIFFPPLLLGLGAAALLIKPSAPQVTVEDFKKLDKISSKNIVDNLENNAKSINDRIRDMNPGKVEAFTRKASHKLMDTGADALYYLSNQVELARDPQEIFLLEKEANRIMGSLFLNEQFSVVPTDLVDNILSPNMKAPFMPSIIEKDENKIPVKISIMEWYASKDPLTRSQAMDYLKETVGLNISNMAYQIKNSYKQQEIEKRRHTFRSI